MRYRAGSDASAASGRASELSEWQRSTADEGFSKPRKMSGTATGKGSNDHYRTVHALKKQKPQVITCGSARRKEERKNEKLNLSNYIVP